MNDNNGKQTGPLRIGLKQTTEAALSGPAEAPPVPDPATRQKPPLEQAIRMGARRTSWLSRMFWWLLGVLVSMALALWGWETLTSLISRSTILGNIALVLSAAFLLVIFLILLRELAGFSRLKRLDRFRSNARQVQASDNPDDARLLAGQIAGFYRQRADVSWAIQNFETLERQTFDAAGILSLAEREILVPLDKAARQEVEAAVRQVATVTALVPLAFADLLVALTANMRMIRRVAETYGGRTGALGNWRLTRAVLAHLVATGIVAVGDDLIGSVAGGSVLSKFSRRFGEGIVNGALTARVGIAAMDVCRPLPFDAVPRPGITSVLKHALGGLFTSGKAKSGTTGDEAES